MYEKLNTLRGTCTAVGVVALWIFIILCLFTNGSSGFIVGRVITAAIALTAYSIQCGAEVISNEKIGNSVFLVLICLLDTIVSAMMLV